MTKDPVCKMDVDETRAEHSSQYGGRKYYFCSEDCKEKFDNQPEKYTATAA
ncbi:MAG TPA: YHS domain-containing protein [Terriglobales bacterium]|nr:YHS domain-containing protein [Terriglobales bacterium]